MVANSNIIKNKFGTLLSIVHSFGFVDDAINEMIINSDFFDCFENNNDNVFLQAGIEDIVVKVFNKNIYIDYNKPLISEYYWAGQSYIQIMLNNDVPLKRILLFLPLKEMINLFPVYHEINPLKLCQRYKKIEESNNLLKILMDREKYSIRKLSYLCGIKDVTLISYLQDNKKMFNASYKNIVTISNQFSISMHIFSRCSSYVPYFDFMSNDDEFINKFVMCILTYLNINNNGIKVINNYVDNKEIIKLLKKYKKVLYVKDKIIVYSSRNKIILSEIEYRSLLKKTIKIFLGDLNSTLLF